MKYRQIVLNTRDCLFLRWLVDPSNNFISKLAINCTHACHLSAVYKDDLYKVSIYIYINFLVVQTDLIRKLFAKGIIENI